ncbi:SDR family oxidoreductase [Streptomyces sp. CAU 1734]|uniref:SDR family oxidoreductase n=1 Tax=Streptomyces sp. CAU 1734 TaxID=3140360 RepID=UPI003260ED82
MSVVVTAATGALGRLVIEELLTRLPADRIAAVVRDRERAADLAARGIELRIADYGDPEALAGAFRPGDRVLLISGNELGRRVAQHTAVIEAAKTAGVAQLAFTSFHRAPDAEFRLAEEYRVTERVLTGSGVPYTILRNGWYTENNTDRLAAVLAHDAVIASAGAGRISSASRADYAAAAAAVLTGDGHLGRAYDLTGEVAWSYEEYAAELSRQSGRTISYRNVPAEAHLDVLTGAGMPQPMAEIFVDLDAKVAQGAMAHTTGDLAGLIGRAPTPLAETVRTALATH